MKKLIQVPLALSLALLIASPVFAGDDKKKSEKGDKAKAERKVKADKPKAENAKAKKSNEKRTPNIVRIPKGIELSADQQTAVAKINEKYAGKLGEIRKQIVGLVTDEQRKAKAEAIKAAREAGKKGPEAREAVAKAGQLTDQQKAKAAELKKAGGEIMKQVHAEFKGILTKEQLASLGSKRKADPEAAKKRAGERKKRLEELKKKRDAAKAGKKKADAGKADKKKAEDKK